MGDMHAAHRGSSARPHPALLQAKLHPSEQHASPAQRYLANELRGIVRAGGSNRPGEAASKSRTEAGTGAGFGPGGRGRPGAPVATGAAVSQEGGLHEG